MRISMYLVLNNHQALLLYYKFPKRFVLFCLFLFGSCRMLCIISYLRLNWKKEWRATFGRDGFSGRLSPSASET